MAKPKDANGTQGAGVAGTTAGSNSKTLNTIRQECARGFREIFADRAELNEAAGELRTRLREAGINPQSFLVGLKLADMEDGAARDAHLDEIKMTLESCGVGTQGSLLVERLVPREGEEDVRPAFLKAKTEGAAA